jgi:hypothetical protein
VNNDKGKVFTVRVPDNFVANSTAVVSEIFVHPLACSTVDHPTPSPPAAHVIRVDPKFKMIFLAICGFTVLSFVVDVIFTWLWTTPTVPQEAFLDHVGQAWAGGIGAICGLLGGKNL